MLDLHPDEKILAYIRRHWIFLLLDILGVVLIFLSVAFVIWFIQFMGYVPDFQIFGTSFYSLTDVLVWMWAIFCWLLLAEKFTDYSLDVWILTDKRIVESELVKLFDRRLSTLELQDIEDVSVEVNGFWESIINFGSLEVQTAGAKREFLAENIENPTKVQALIFGAKLANKKEDMDIEKGEFEQIAHRVTQEEGIASHIPQDQKVANTFVEKINPEKTAEEKKHEFDWAHINNNEENESDVEIRKLEEELARLEEKYRKNAENALRSE